MYELGYQRWTGEDYETIFVVITNLDHILGAIFNLSEHSIVDSIELNQCQT